MGKLFWKFFFVILAAQLATALGVGGAFWWREHVHMAAHAEAVFDPSPPAAFALEATATALQYGGAAAAKKLVTGMGHHTVLVYDASQRELLNRRVDGTLLAQARTLAQAGDQPRLAREVSAPDGQVYVLFVPATHERFGHAGGPAAEPAMGRDQAPREPPGGRFSPLILLLAATAASLLCAALLARYFFRPIRHLRDAFAATAAGNFKPQLRQSMGTRRDELADLGHDFDHMAGQLQTLMDGQRRLLHHVSHELRSPIARQQIAIGLARQQPARIDDLLDRIERDGQRMDQLVGDVLVLSRLEAGLLTGASEDVAIDELLAAIAEDAGFEADACGVRIALTGASRATISGHAELLHSAIENVVRNAIKHTASGSTVAIRSTCPPASAQVEVVVEDAGPGLPATQLEAIFEPFFRSPENVSAIPGHGLGLTIARHIIDAHGGTISAANRPSGGLQVRIVLPLKNA